MNAPIASLQSPCTSSTNQWFHRASQFMASLPGWTRKSAWIGNLAPLLDSPSGIKEYTPPYMARASSGARLPFPSNVNAMAISLCWTFALYSLVNSSLRMSSGTLTILRKNLNLWVVLSRRNVVIPSPSSPRFSSVHLSPVSSSQISILFSQRRNRYSSVPNFLMSSNKCRCEASSRSGTMKVVLSGSMGSGGLSTQIGRTHHKDSAGSGQCALSNLNP